jgi:8-oxo-dGTP pyrophosphatase MutT (NUDIX family)
MAAPTRIQISAGGVAYRREGDRIEVALIAVESKGERRWQLPKGIVGQEEEKTEAAVREVREEAGVQSELLDEIETIEYWYYGSGGKVRFHKYVHFYLMEYRSGDTSDYDQREVEEARWVEIEEAQELLAFDNEKEVVHKAAEMIRTREAKGG